jgi:hypothetical protein
MYMCFCVYTLLSPSSTLLTTAVSSSPAERGSSLDTHAQLGFRGRVCVCEDNTRNQ